LEYPLPADTPAVYQKYLRRQVDGFWDAYQRVLEAPRIDSDAFVAAIQRFLLGNVAALDTPTSSERSEVANDPVPAKPDPVLTAASDALSASPREKVDAYLALAQEFCETGVRLHYADFWRAAHYTDRTTYYDWLSMKASKTVAANFERVFQKPPARFAAEAEQVRAKLKARKPAK
jgi:hypothetical protein